DDLVTGVQTCALPISHRLGRRALQARAATVSESAATHDDNAGVTPVRLLAVADPEVVGGESLLDSYRRLADVFHDILAEQSLDKIGRASCRERVETKE